MSLVLHAYGPSVYCQIVRMALAEIGLRPTLVEIDPFDGTDRNPHPFGLVPVLKDGASEIYETAAILHYLDARYGGAAWIGRSAIEQARIRQVQAIADNHAYWPLVRQVFAHAVFRPAHGEDADEETIAEGLAAAGTVLGALDGIAAEGEVLTGERLTLADLHLAPMIGFFATASQGVEMLGRFPALASWFAQMCLRPSFRDTCPPVIELP